MEREIRQMKNEKKQLRQEQLPRRSVGPAGCLITLQHNLGEESLLQTT